MMRNKVFYRPKLIVLKPETRCFIKRRMVLGFLIAPKTGKNMR